MTDSDNTPEDDPGVIVDALVSETACARRSDFELGAHHCAAPPPTLPHTQLEHQGLEMFVQNLKRLNENETEESQGVYDTLGTRRGAHRSVSAVGQAHPARKSHATATVPHAAVFENLLEIRPEIGDTIVKANFLDWALPRLKQRAFDQNKQYTSELLAILLQNSTRASRERADA